LKIVNYYDLHAHVLPGIDDGPKYMSKSLDIARVAYANGTQVMIASPHKLDVNINSSINYIRTLLTEFQKQLKVNNIDLEILLGMENHIDPNLPQDFKDGKALTINDTKYILVELPPDSYPKFVNEVLLKLKLEGLVPIIVHPERHPVIQKTPSMLSELISIGALSQITAGSLVGKFGEYATKTSEFLIRHNLAHLIASDTHSAVGYRNPSLKEGIEAAKSLIGTERALQMVKKTPEAIVHNESILKT